MSNLIQLQNVNFSFDTTPLFEELNFSIDSNSRVALVGHNGCGKSTLLDLLSGDIDLKEGIIGRKKNLKVGRVEQFLPDHLAEKTAIEVISESLSSSYPEEFFHLAEKLMSDLYFRQDEMNTVISKMSGGQKTRVLFLRAIANRPDLLLMDEPTNHLDLNTLLYLEDYLINRSNFSYLIISHDAEFLQKVSTSTIFLRDHTSYSFKLPYYQAKIALEKMDEDRAKKRALEEKEVSRLKTAAKRLATWGRDFDNEDLAKKAKSIEKRAQKLEDNFTELTKGNPYQLNLSGAKLSSKWAMQFSDYQCGYTDENGKNVTLFTIDEFIIKKGDRIALLAENGKGKSTFLKDVARRVENQLEDSNFKFSPQLNLSVYYQEQENINPSSSIWDEVARHTEANDNQIKMALIKAGYQYEDFSKKVGLLSGGEKSRIIFAICNLQNPNFLILDEPTNHLDMDAKEELASSFDSLEFTTLITGHDRAFIQKIANRYMVIKNNILVEIHSLDEFYRWSLKQEGQSDKGKKMLPHKESFNVDHLNSEKILENLVELEEKLEADLKRKPKFQKPKLQKKWQEQIDQLNKLLDSQSK